MLNVNPIMEEDPFSEAGLEEISQKEESKNEQLFAGVLEEKEDI